MKNYRIAALALAALSLVACSTKTSISGVVKDAGEGQIVLRQLNINTYKTLDTLKLDKNGEFKCEVNVVEGCPEFFYLFRGDTQIGAFLLENGENAVLEADTLGNYSVTGSKGSELLAGVIASQSKFRKDLLSNLSDNAALSRAYVDHYRQGVKFILQNPYSLVQVPVLYETVGENSMVFSQMTDGLFFRNAADSLKTVYPDSPYVKALEKEADRRSAILELNTRIQGIEPSGFPDITLPDMSGKPIALSSVDSKVILLYFWYSSDASQKMFNLDFLLPIYEEFHQKGFEIYAVCADSDKPTWASVVRSQKLPWINVNDGLGYSSPAIRLYSPDKVPASIMIVDGHIAEASAQGADGFRRELARLLK